MSCFGTSRSHSCATCYALTIRWCAAVFVLHEDRRVPLVPPGLLRSLHMARRSVCTYYTYVNRLLVCFIIMTIHFWPVDTCGCRTWMIPTRLPWMSLAFVYMSTRIRSKQRESPATWPLATSGPSFFSSHLRSKHQNISLHVTSSSLQQLWHKLVPDASHFKRWNMSVAATNDAMRSSHSCVIVVVNSGRTGNNLKQLFWRKKKKNLRSYVWIVNKIIMGYLEFMQPCEGLLICPEFWQQNVIISACKETKSNWIQTSKKKKKKNHFQHVK